MKAKHRASGRARGGICKLKKTKDGENGEWIVDSALWIPNEAATLRVVAGSDVRAHLDFHADRFLVDDPRTLWSGAREDRRKRPPSPTSGATVDYFRLLAGGGHRGGVFVVDSGDQRSFSWCAQEPQQFAVRYGREYARTTGRRDRLGAGG